MTTEQRALWPCPITDAGRGDAHQRQVQVDDFDLGEIRTDVQRSRSNTLTEARGLPIRRR